MAPSLDEAAARAELEAVAADVARCELCRLHLSGTRGVPGEGPPRARIMFIGEGPGYHEDRLGRPFVGPAGKLLDELLAGIGLRRDDVYITNVVKHRPPGNRDPLPEEILACRPYLTRQMAAIDPQVIGLLGRFALEQFVPGARIGQVHGRARLIDGRTYVPLIHPAAALHKGDYRPLLVADFQALADVLASPPPPSEPPKPPPEQLSLF